MAEVKWIKITTDIFDDEKIILIESLPDSDAIIVVWFKLLCLAGKQNNSGVFMLSNKIAYTDKMLATIFRMKESTVTMALKTFERFGMVEIIDGVITIPNWNKHQSLDAYEKKKKRDRLYQAERRAAQKSLIAQSPDKSSDNRLTVARQSPDKSSDVAFSEEDKEEDKEKNKKRIEYQLIADMYNEICVSFPRLTVLSEGIKQEIQARLNTYSVEQFKAMFEMAEASPFLKGQTGGNWQANFDWMIKDGNFAKILNGNYFENKKAGETYGTNGILIDHSKNDLDDLF